MEIPIEAAIRVVKAVPEEVTWKQILEAVYEEATSREKTSDTE